MLDLIDAVRPSLRAPVVLFSYANPMYRMGFETFAARAAAAGVDGVLALDIPVEEAGPLRDALLGHAPGSDLPAEPDDDARAHAEGRRARPRVSVR